MNLTDSTLDNIKKSIQQNSRFFHLNGNFNLTKTKANFSEALLERDFVLEEESYRYVNDILGENELLSRYHNYDRSVVFKKNPPHYAMRILSGAGSICSGENIFMFFPFALGLPIGSREDSFGFEFIDVWENIFRESIFSCVKEVFSLQSQIEVRRVLASKLDRTIFMASVFHELGHEVGPWRVSPDMRADMNLDGIELDILGELATDSLMIRLLPEFKELPIFIILQRIFWFCRRGFRENPKCGMLNTDNDAWIGIYLWNKLIKNGVLSWYQGQLHYQSINVQGCFREIIEDVDALFIPYADLKEQREQVNQWRAQFSDKNSGIFQFPEDLKKVFSKCQAIVEVPQFFPQFEYDKIEEITHLCTHEAINE